MIVLHLGKPNSNLLKMLFPPIEFPNMSENEEFDKGVDLVANTGELKLGFNLFNVNFDLGGAQSD